MDDAAMRSKELKSSRISPLLLILSLIMVVAAGWQAELVGDRVARLVSGDLAVKWDGSKPVIV